MKDKTKELVLWFDEISNDDVALVGGKNASLGEMYTTLASQGIRVPNGFVVTAFAYREFIRETGLMDFIKKSLDGLDTKNIKDLQSRGKKIREKIASTSLPKNLQERITLAYKELSSHYTSDATDVAVRSSATAEDLPGASFAGEHETYLNVYSIGEVLKMTRLCFASLFNDRAISYRVDKKFDHFDVALSVGIQKMVRSDKGSSGVMFTLDTESGFRDVVEINASYGLGEMVVQGKVTPDEYIVFKPTLKKGFSPIIKKVIGSKETQMIYSGKRDKPVREVMVPLKDRSKFVLNQQEILTLGRWAIAIEEHYTKRYGKDTPMDMEWAKDGITKELFIVQARPETVQSERNHLSITTFSLTEKAEAIVEGASVGTKIASGKARIITDVHRLNEFVDGEILVTEITDPDWEPIMKRASAIITDKGGRTSHAAIVSRELGIPAVIGTGNATSKIKTGDVLTIDTTSGTTGKVYRGKLHWQEKVENVASLPETRTKICMNIGSPDSAFVYSFIPNKGVGLAREEFIIASHIKVHPMALIHFDKIKSPTVRKQIKDLTEGYESMTEFYVSRLAEGIAQIGAAFYPNQVIVRFSDFKTNEYAQLLGGAQFEPKEENPMIGWRGASRYAHPNFREAFELECEAIKKVREGFGIDNVHVMVPFCRTPEEGEGVLNVMKECGIGRGLNNLKVYVMCEIPTNVIRADDFLDIFDGFSIGSNDLAQLTLGLDRDSAVVAGISNENDPAVKRLVAEAIRVCKKRNKYIGFCGQAPSDYPDFLRFLVGEGIEAVSLNPDSIIPMILEVKKEEDRLGAK